MKALWKRLLEIDESSAKELFMKFVNECKLVIEPMHANNGNLRKVLHALNKLKLFEGVQGQQQGQASLLSS